MIGHRPCLNQSNWKIGIRYMKRYCCIDANNMDDSFYRSISHMYSLHLNYIDI